MTDAVRKAKEKIKRWRLDPVFFVRDQFGVEPDEWQKDVLKAFADPKIQRISQQACAGPGKSAVMAWCGLNFLSCYADKGQHPNGAAMSISESNLKDNLWKELAVWINKSAFLKAAFVWTKERIFAKDHPSTWFMSARSWSKTANQEEQGRTLSGLHSQYVLYLIDESGDIAPSVLRAAEQGLSNCKWGKILQAGNPTSHNGILYLAASSQRHLWHVVTITGDPDDANRSKRIDAEWAREQIGLYGRDNPWVMAYILGKFPPSSMNTLLSPEEVDGAMKLGMNEDQYSWAQKRLGIDVARFGDDRTVIFPRQGLMAFKPVIMRHERTTDIAARVAMAKEKWGSEMEFVDDSGHWGHGVIDNLLAAGHSPQAVFFEGKAIDPRYRNKRTEMWLNMADWVKRGGCLPNMPELIRELTAPTYTFVNGVFQLEPKDLLKKRIGVSPDLADALCFVKNTMVNTPTGRRPIQDFKIGDEVSTPMGSTRVAKVWKSETKLMTTVKFSNGSVLSGKPEHRIFTFDQGWVRLDALSLSNVIESDNLSRKLLWQLLKNLFTPAIPFGFKQRVDTINRAGRMYRRDFFIVGSIGSIMAQFLMDIAYTIKMGIGLITGLKTLNWCIAGNTPQSICARDFRILNTEIETKKTSGKLSARPLNGTKASPGFSGIASMGKELGSTEKNQPHQIHVFIAGKHFQPISHQEQNSAQEVVSKLSIIKSTKRLLVNVFCAVKNLCLTSIGLNDIVPVSVQTSTVSPTKTYNLTLETENVYYANGILASNCLTFAAPEMPGSNRLLNMVTGAKAGKVQHEYNPYAEAIA